MASKSAESSSSSSGNGEDGGRGDSWRSGDEAGLAILSKASMESELTLQIVQILHDLIRG